MRRAILAAVLGLIVVLPASASASFHLVKISEVGNANPADYVELQAYASGQNFVVGHYVRVYDDLDTLADIVQKIVFTASRSNITAVWVAGRRCDRRGFATNA